MTNIANDAGVPATAAVEDDSLPVIRRRSRKMFVPAAPPSSDLDVIVARGILSSRQSARPTTSRHRKIAGNLPDWEPLPPGEVFVSRPGAK